MASHTHKHQHSHPAPPPSVSVIIPTLNAARTIRMCLDALKKQEYDPSAFEVIVADGGSTDGTTDIVRDFPFCTLVKSNSSGPMAGRWDGFQRATGDVIAYIDADCITEPDWAKNGIRQLLELERTTGTGVVIGGAILIPRTSVWTESNGIFLALAWWLGFSVQTETVRETHEVMMVPTVNFFTRRETLSSVLPYPWKGFGEDIELSHRILMAGNRLFSVPNTAVWHYRRPSPMEFFEEMRNYSKGRFHFANAHSSYTLKQYTPHFLMLAMLLSLYAAASFGPAALIALCVLSYTGTVIAALRAKQLYQYKLSAAFLAPFTCLVAICAWVYGSTEELISPSDDGTIPIS